MAIKKISETYGACWNDRRYEYLVDTDADFKNLPECSGVGSTAVSIESGKIKVVNTKGEWVDFGG